MIVFANDSPEKTANCVARFIETSYGTYGPFIVTKRDIAKNEELTYSYGNYPYEWRKKDTGCKRAVEESVPSQGERNYMYFKVLYCSENVKER